MKIPLETMNKINTRNIAVDIKQVYITLIRPLDIIYITLAN